MRILVTGFEPFGNEGLNSSQKLVECMPDTMPENISLIKSILPVDHDRAPKILLDQIHNILPDAVLSFGLAFGRSKISLERVALNLMDFRIPDNGGVTISNQPVVKDAPAAYFTTLPVQEIISALQKNGVPAETSLTAGSFICNQVFFTMLHEINKKSLPIRAGFVHLPALPEQAAQSDRAISSLSLDLMVQAAHCIISQLHNSHK